jgi:hypothetical protein
LHIKEKKMAKKTWLRGAALALIAAVALAGCSKAQAQAGGSGGANSSVKEAPETDFKVQVTKDGQGVRIEKYTGDAKAVRIPATMQGLPVREMDTSAFQFNKTITSVIIPEGVTSVHGFGNCANLTSVSFPTTLKYIGGFRGTKLTTVDLSGTSIERIRYGAFDECASLTSIALPASIKIIENLAFIGCAALTTVTVPETVTKIEFALEENKGKWKPNEAFYKCSKIPLATQAKIRDLGYTGPF